MKYYTIVGALLIVGNSYAQQGIPTCRVPSECVGTWKEVEQIGWKNTVVVPEPPIGELIIQSEGWFSVTWHPFETYQDFWGVCHFPPGTNTVQFFILSGNHIPKYFRGCGIYQFNNGHLVFEGMSFGHQSAKENELKQPVKAIFGHVFKRTGSVPEPSLPNPRVCDKCGAKFDLCPYCGSQLPAQLKCEECGYPTDKCMKCAPKPREKKANNRLNPISGSSIKLPEKD